MKHNFSSSTLLSVSRALSFILLASAALKVAGQSVPSEIRDVKVSLDLSKTNGPMKIGNLISFSQGGQSPDPIWLDRAPLLRALHPTIIRIFLQEFMDEMPARNTYNWEKLDKMVDMVLETGAEPLMDIVFKPKVLYPKIDPKIIYPTSWEDWDNFISAMVKHYKERGSKIRYWEMGDEYEIGEDGGCAYLCTPENYAVWYEHTAKAVMRADPDARVGGPASPWYESPFIPYLLSYCESNQVPIHYLAWHIYDNDPQKIRDTIDYNNNLLKKHPALKLETLLGEWNVSLGDPPLDVRYQPCFITESVYQMKEAGLTYATYYHIRDFHPDYRSFTEFETPRGAAGIEVSWNRGLQVQVSGIFDYQDTMRPSYFAFKLLSRLTGERLTLTSNDGAVHGLAAWDSTLQLYTIVLWNFSNVPAKVNFSVENSPYSLNLWQRILDAETSNNDENVRLRPLPWRELDKPNMQLEFELKPYEVRSLTFRKKGKIAWPESY
jgi:xylan 1,4-beta-xylosidase